MTAPTPDRPPLWRVIENCDAFIPVQGLLRRRLIAMLICAVRDWLVPEELDPPVPGPHEQCVGSRWAERQRLRALLTGEAQRAEQGDG